MPAKPLAVGVHRDLNPSLGNLQVVVGFQDEESGVVDARSLITPALQNLVDIAAWGGMAGDLYEPANSRMAMVVTDSMISAGRHLWGFECRDVHPGILLVVQNLLERFHQRSRGIATVEFRSTLAKTSEAADSLPCDYEPYPFLVEYGMSTAQVLVDVDFDGRYDASGLNDFRRPWRAWESVAIDGGFSDATYPVEKSTLHVEDDLCITSTGLSCSFDGVAIADAGFYCLVNMLQTFHHRLARVEHVMIE
jgi:hypothetical protein